MLVSLSIKNFKSIREAHVRFGPFTCFVGHNGAGKSNLFDAIHFLGALAARDIAAAATEVRRTSDGGSSPLDLVFGRDPDRRIELGADMVVPPRAEDDFGQQAKPSTTLLTYRIRLRYEPRSDRLLVEHESLTHAKLRPISGAWRADLPDGGGSSAQPIDRQAVANFIGGSPVNPALGRLRFDFGSAR